MMKNGKLSDLLGGLHVWTGDGSKGDYDVSDAVIAQVRRLATEVRQLASSRQITVMNGVSGANLQSLVVPAAALGALGYIVICGGRFGGAKARSIRVQASDILQRQ